MQGFRAEERITPRGSAGIPGMTVLAMDVLVVVVGAMVEGVPTISGAVCQMR